MWTNICFIISPIGKPGTETRRRSDLVLEHIISPVVTSLNYKPMRADQLPEPGLISRQIIRYLENSPLVIADLTERNPNVFYELAIRHIVNKPLVPIIKKGEEIPFDVADARTVWYDIDLDSAKSARQQLEKMIKAFEDPNFELDNDPLEKHTISPNDRQIMLNQISEIRQNLNLMLSRTIDIDTNNPSYLDTTISEENRSKIDPIIKSAEELGSISRLLEGRLDAKKHLQIAYLITVKGEFEKAIKEYDRILRQEPLNVNALHAKAITLDKSGNGKEAVIYYDKVLEIDPKNIDALSNRLLLLNTLGRTDELMSESNKAIAIYDEVIKVDQRDLNVLISKGIALVQIGKYDKAISCYDTVLEIDPKNARAIYNKACAKSLQGKVDESLKLLKESISLESKFKVIAKKDIDFRKIREDIRFKKLI